MRIISGMSKGTKLYTLEGENTRPTLDRVKESLFSIMMSRIPDSTVLDLFAGSGALGLETLSRGAKRVVFCDNSNKAVKVIRKNIDKTKFNASSIVINKDYCDALKKVASDKMKFDIIFLDPPYETSHAIEAIKIILRCELLNQDGIIILETDNKEKILKDIEKLDINVYDIREYGRVRIIFLNRKLENSPI